MLRARSSFSAAGFSAVLLAASQTGVTPRPAASDYPVHRATKTTTVAAVLVPASEIKKIFPGEIAKKYAVVEVAVYPGDGYSVDIDSLDFALQLCFPSFHPARSGTGTAAFKGLRKPGRHFAHACATADAASDAC